MPRPQLLCLLLMLSLLTAACDSAGDDEDAETNVIVTVEGLDTYAFSEPARASLRAVPGAVTEVLSIRLEEEPTSESRIGLQLDLEVEDVVADSTYSLLYSTLDRDHIGDGAPGMWARFFDCPPRVPGVCRRDYYATSNPSATLFFVQIIALTDTRVAGAFGFFGFVPGVSGASTTVRGTFSLPLER